MKQLYTDLWQSEKGDHFGLALKTYLLKTAEGNIVIYYTNDRSEEKQLLRQGVSYQLISHHHEFQTGFFKNLSTLKPKLIIHKNTLEHKHITYDNTFLVISDTVFLKNLDIIDTPGHTDNSLCFYYKSPNGKNYLFTGDTIFLNQNTWDILVLPSEGGSYIDLKSSLEKLRELQVDVIFCSVAVGKNRHVEVTNSEWREIINNCIALINRRINLEK